MAKNRELVEPQSESESDSDRRTSTPNVANAEETSSSSEEEYGSGSEPDGNGSRKPRSRSSAGPTVKKGKEDEERRAREKKQKEIKAGTSLKKSNDDSKKLLFQRIWSEDDEIAILNGMTEYVSKKKSDPMANLSDFHDFIKKNLQLVDVTRTQLQHKIRRLKKKYQNNKNKAKDGKDRTFSKSHDQKAYDLSKTVWGNEVGKKKGGEEIKKEGSNSKAGSKRAAAEDEKEGGKDKGALIVRGEGESSSLGKRWSVAERILRAGTELFEGGEGVGEDEKEWKKLKMEEIELYCKQLELKLAQSRLVLDVLKSNDQ